MVHAHPRSGEAFHEACLKIEEHAIHVRRIQRRTGPGEM